MKSELLRRFTQSMLVQSSVRSYLEPLIRLWRPHFRAGAISAKVLKIKKQAGFVWLTLKPSAQFKGFTPGQHVDLSIEIEGKRIQRTFSICSSLQEFQQNGTIELAIKLVKDGQLSRWLSGALCLGTQVHLSQAYGNFVLRQQNALCLVAAGSGITPIRAMLLSISRMTQPITLIYSYRADGLFNQDFIDMAAKFPLFKFIAHDSATMPRLTNAAIAQYCNTNTDFYLCGPTSFISELNAALTPIANQIFSESFGGVTAAADEQTVTFYQHQQPKFIQGKGSLLVLAEQAGLNPRYGCRRGICQQCQCQKISGQVRNMLTGELSTAGSEPIQLCISEAVTSVDVRF